MPKHKSSIKFAAFLLFTLFLLLAAGADSQELPDKIRGYKGYNANIRVESSPTTSKELDKEIATVTLGEPSIVEFGLSGLTFEVSAKIASLEKSGKVDFVAFRGFTVGGIPVEIEEYKHPFKFKKGHSTPLPVPARIFVRSTNLARAAFKEMVESEKEWPIAGTAFVFGQFKMFGFSFKRVIPVAIKINIPNPIRG
jgi:hypothetical protein